MPGPACDISVVLVTFNRLELLRQCISGILSQTAAGRIGAIHIIDNASTDGTDSAIPREYADEPKIRYARMDSNLGGSGGFRRGMELAHRDGCTWIWTLDDDVEPMPDCLENMLKFQDISLCINPLVQYADGSLHEWEHMFDPVTTAQTGLRNLSFGNGKDWCPMRVACFEGMLVHTSIVSKIGYPDDDFFVFGDDGHYGFMASLHTNVIFVRSGRLLKKIKPDHQVTPFKVYYDVRNRFLLRRKLLPWYERHRYQGRLFWIFILHHARNMTRGGGKLAKLKAALLGIYDGCRGVTGRKRY